MSASNIFFFASITSLLTNIPWTAIFFITQFLGLRLYIIRRTEECQKIQKRISNTTSEIGDGGKGQGWALGYWYFLHLENRGGDMNIWMIATATTYENFMKDIQHNSSITKGITGITGTRGTEETAETVKIPQKKISVTQRMGSFAMPWYRSRDISITLTPRLTQQTIIDKILENYTKTSHTVAYIWGPPGTGKSMIGLFIAQQTEGIYCNTLKPWEPNDTLQSVYSEIEPSETKPLILIFDEFDAVITELHNGTILSHKNFPIAVQNKSGWNHMLDEIQRGMYPNLILILTSNCGPEFFNNLDPSYIREGRVDLTFEF